MVMSEVVHLPTDKCAICRKNLGDGNGTIKVNGLDSCKLAPFPVSYFGYNVQWGHLTNIKEKNCYNLFQV